MYEVDEARRGTSAMSKGQTEYARLICADVMTSLPLLS